MKWLCVVFVLSSLFYACCESAGCTTARQVLGFPYEYEDNTADEPISSYSCDSYSSSTQGQGVWFSFTGNNKVATINLCDDYTDYDTLLFVFTTCGTDGKGSTCIAVNDDYCDRKSQVTFHAASGTVYYVFVTGFDVSAGYFKIEFVEETAPTHDSCSSALIIPDYSTYYYTTGTTTFTVPTTTPCRNVESAGLWYRFMGVGVPYVAHTCDTSTDFDTVIEVYSACSNDIPSTCVAFNDDGCLTRSSVVWNAERNTHYWILVTGFNNARGTFFLNIEQAATQPHYTCGKAVYVSTLPYIDYNSNYGAPTSYSPCTQKDLHALYYRFHGNGEQIVISTCGQNNYVYDTVLSVYDTCNNGTAVAGCINWNDDFCGIHSHVVIQSVLNKEYYVQVAGYRNDATLFGNFTLLIDLASNHENGQCWHADDITLPFSIQQDTYDIDPSIGACKETALNRTGRWYRYFNPMTTNAVTASTCNTETASHTYIEVYTDCSMSNCVIGNTPCNSLQSLVSWTAHAGTMYYIFVATTSTDRYFSFEFYESDPNPYSQCAAPLAIPSLPYSNFGDTMTSAQAYSLCGTTYKTGQWFSFAGTGNKVIVTTCDQMGRTDYDTMLEIYSGCKSSPTDPTPASCLYSDDDYHEGDVNCGVTSLISFVTQLNAQYLVYVTGFSVQNQGMFVLQVYEESPPFNSRCNEAVYFSPPLDTLGFTTYSIPSNGTCAQGTREGQWYQFEALPGYKYDISTCHAETDFDTEIELYKGCDIRAGGMQCVPAFDDMSCAPYTHVVLSEMIYATEPDHYFIFVTGFEESAGFFRLTVNGTKVAVASSSSHNHGGGGGLSGGAKAGIVFGVLIGVGLIAAGCVVGYLYYKRRINVYSPLQ